MPERIQLRRAKGWRLPENAVNCARPGPWGNPFVVGRDGTREDCVRLHKTLMCGYVCLTCKATIEEQKAALEYSVAHIDELRGKDLACWCKGKPCHCDTLIEAANA